LVEVSIYIKGMIKIIVISCTYLVAITSFSKLSFYYAFHPVPIDMLTNKESVSRRSKLHHA